MGLNDQEASVLCGHSNQNMILHDSIDDPKYCEVQWNISGKSTACGSASMVAEAGIEIPMRLPNFCFGPQFMNTSPQISYLSSNLARRGNSAVILASCQNGVPVVANFVSPRLASLLHSPRFP